MMLFIIPFDPWDTRRVTGRTAETVLVNLSRRGGVNESVALVASVDTRV